MGVQDNLRLPLDHLRRHASGSARQEFAMGFSPGSHIARAPQQKDASAVDFAGTRSS